MNAALYFHPEAYSTSGPRLMGRNAAGESFLRGFLTHGKSTEFWVQVQSLAHARQFSELARARGRQELIRAVDRSNLGALAKVGAVFHPGPGIGMHAWQRGAVAPSGGMVSGHAAWSLCGITHSTSSAVAMDALTELLTAPVQPWDAVICTSTAVKENVEYLLHAQAEHLKQRLGATRLTLPQLPVIPLGIHTQDFAFSTGDRAMARRALGVDAKAHVVLFMGRLSFHAKAHPLAMYQALEKAAQGLPSGESVVLVECGWHANEQIAKAFADAARLACPSVRVVNLDGRLPAQRDRAWAGADVFCSLSDNIQETFGITPIEAMAAGLPVVVSDWDGYKDTVRDGADGFRIPTLMPSADPVGDLASRHALELDTYDMYCGHTCSLVAVDVEAAAEAFRSLFASAELRRLMGESGRQRAKDLFDWEVIVPRYEALWAQLAGLRQSKAGCTVARGPAWPARTDPFLAFSGYPTQTLGHQTRLALVDNDANTAFQRTLSYKALAMVDFAKVVLPTDAEVHSVLSAAGRGPMSAAEIVAGIPPQRQSFVWRSLAWLLKLGVLRVA